VREKKSGKEKETQRKRNKNRDDGAVRGLGRD